MTLAGHNATEQISQPLRIEPINTARDLRALVRFPFDLYRSDPLWVPPFVEERLAFFDPRKNPFFDHARSQLFVARRGNTLVGTIGAVVDDNYNRFHNECMGGFGFFECHDDQQAANGLLDAAETWARTQGATFMRGPLNFSTNQEVGLLIDGVPEPPMVLMTYNPPYYARLIKQHGYHKSMDLYAYIGDIDARMRDAPPRVFRVAEKAMQQHGVRVRRLNLNRFDQELELVKYVYNHAWQRNWGFVPMTDRELEHLANSLRPFLDPELLLIAETTDGTPIGVSITIPDINQPLLRSGGGHMLPFGVLKFLWHRRSINQVRLLIMGVVEGYRTRGIDAVFYVETARAALARGYHRMEGSWILENNTMMNRIIQHLGGQCYKTYRLYERSLA